jgi:hypothetical protein
MLLSNDISHSSGYIKLDENHRIEESSGPVYHILRIEHLDSVNDLSGIINGLKKNLKSFFETELLPAIQLRENRHLNYTRKNSLLTFAVVPLNSGTTFISIQEKLHSDKLNELSLPEKLKEVLIRVDADL